MTNDIPRFSALSDEELLARVRTLAGEERHATASLIAALAELDERRLYLGQGYPSLFAYCTQALHLSEDAAYNRIRAARAAAKWPVILKMIADGSITVTAVRVLSDVLTNANHEELLRAASRKSKREVEVIVAALSPQPIVSPSIRKIPARTRSPLGSLAATQSLATSGPDGMNEKPSTGPSPSPLTVPKSPVVAPLSADHYKINFAIPKATHEKLRRVQDLMRHTNPKGDPAVIFDRALTLLLEQLEKSKLGKARRPRTTTRGMRPGSRHIPASVKREVWHRDDGRCAFVGSAGRCTETGFLEYHHVTPYADGGDATTANIQLRCRAHNVYEADQWFGVSMVRERHDGCAKWSRDR